MLTIIAIVMVPLFFVGLAMSREAAYLHDQITSGAIDLQAQLRFLRRMAPVASDYLAGFGMEIDGARAALVVGVVQGAIGAILFWAVGISRCYVARWRCDGRLLGRAGGTGCEGRRASCQEYFQIER